MRKFAHINASSIDEAVSWLRRYGLKANVIAGGTDLLGKLKDEIFPNYPEVTSICSDGIVSDARICLNAVYVIPYRAVKAEKAMLRKAMNEFNAEAAGEAAVSAATPLKHNRYTIQIAKTMVKRAILACMVF